MSPDGELLRTLTLDFIWQASVLLGMGLLGSFIWTGRPARAHRWLSLILIAAFLAAPLSAIVRSANWGWFEYETTRAWVAPESRVAAMSHVSAPSVASDPTPLVTVPEVVQVAFDTARFSLASFAVPLLLIWAGVSFVLLMRIVRSFIQGRRLVAGAQPCDDPHIIEALEGAAHRIELDVHPDLRLASQITSPMIWCWAKPPIILLPREVTRRAGMVDWHAVFAHELAHLKRHDHLSFLAAEILTCLMPWNPLAWWTRRRMGELAEWSCDDWAVVCSRNAVGYAESILNLLPQAWPTQALAAVRHTRGLAGRIHAILADRLHEPRTGFAWSAVTSSLAISLVAAIAFAQVTSPPASPRTLASRDNAWWTHWESNREMVVPDPIFDVQPTVATDAYVEVHLRNAARLHTLSLKDSQITDRSLVVIGELPALRSLIVASTAITDDGLSHLTGAARLELIDLSDTNITDAGLSHLATIACLRTINLTGCPVTDAGIASLRKALPQATVIFSP